MVGSLVLMLYLFHNLNYGMKCKPRLLDILTWRKSVSQTTEKPGVPYTWRNGLVPPNSQIIRQLLRAFHDSQFGGHSGVLQTYENLHNNYIGHLCIRECRTTSSQRLCCLQDSCNHCPFHDISMDFIQGLPSTLR